MRDQRHPRALREAGGKGAKGKDSGQVTAGYSPSCFFWALYPGLAEHAIAASLSARAVSLTQVARDHGLIRAVDPRVTGLTVLGAIDALLFEQLRQGRAAAEIPRVVGELVGIVVRGVLA